MWRDGWRKLTAVDGHPDWLCVWLLTPYISKSDFTDATCQAARYYFMQARWWFFFFHKKNVLFK